MRLPDGGTQRHAQDQEPQGGRGRHPEALEARRNAIKSALAQKHREGKLVCLEGLVLPSHKTQELEALVADGLKITGKALFLDVETNNNLELAVRNNPRLTAVRALGASIVDLLGHDMIVVSEPALLKLTEVLTK